MKTHTPIISILFLSLIVWQGCGGKAKQFNITLYEKTPSKVSSKYIESKVADNLNASAFKRIAIIEFNIEYLVNMPDSAYINTTEDLYEIFVESIEANTDWQVINKSKIIENEIFRVLRKKPFSGNVIGKLKGEDRDRKISTIYPAIGLGILPKMIPAMQGRLTLSLESSSNEAALLEGVLAEAALKVHTIVDFSRKGKGGNVQIVPFVKGISSTSRVDIYIGYIKKPSLVGEDFYYSYRNHCTFELKKHVTSYESITAKPGTFDLEEFVYWTKEMFRIYSEMLAIEISENL